MSENMRFHTFTFWNKSFNLNSVTTLSAIIPYACPGLLNLWFAASHKTFPKSSLCSDIAPCSVLRTLLEWTRTPLRLSRVWRRNSHIYLGWLHFHFHSDNSTPFFRQCFHRCGVSRECGRSDWRNMQASCTCAGTPGSWPFGVGVLQSLRVRRVSAVSWIAWYKAVEHGEFYWYVFHWKLANWSCFVSV